MATESCGAVVSRMVDACANCAIIRDGLGNIVGIVTEQDVVRRQPFRGAADLPVGQAMTRAVQTIGEDEFLYTAIARMRRGRLRQMPVLSGAGELLGVLALHDALAAGMARTIDLIDTLTLEDSVEGLHAIKAAQVEVARLLLDEGTAATQVQSLLSDINLDIHRRLLGLLASDLEAEGEGPLPASFALIVMGSGGRGESFLYPDQDNGFVLADSAANDPRADKYFLTLAKRMTAALDRIGFPLCKGDVMATNPVWRKPISGWRVQLAEWIGQQRDSTTLLADVFFDFRVAGGAAALGEALRAEVMRLIRDHPAFLSQMYRIEADHDVALGFFNRLSTDRRDGTETIDLKLHGTLPLVEGVRLYALKSGIAETSTCARMDALRADGVLDADEHDYLSGAFAHITAILLRQQIRDFLADHPVSARVDPQTLSERERDMLVDGLKAIRALRVRVRADFGGQLF